MNHKATKSLSILSFNTLGTPIFAPVIAARYKFFSEYLNASAIDIICLQEVTTYYHLSLLKKYLTNYPHIAYKKFYYGPKGGVAIFSRVPLTDVRYASFAALGSLMMYTQLLRNGILSCKVAGLPLRILNTHLISDFEYKSSSTNKYYPYVRQQVLEVAKLSGTFAQEGNTVFAVGDFNLSKQDPTYKEFLKQTKGVDTFAHEDIPTYYNDRHHWRFNASKSARIDYIFLLDRYDKIQIKSTKHVLNDTVQLTKNLNSFPSDHLGLLTSFNIKI